MPSNRQKFQELLRKLFQFESADLDFGIYRIMNYKRDVIEKFIEKDLPDAISKELKKGALAQESKTVDELRKITEKIREGFSEEAIDGDGNLAEEYSKTKLGKKYLELQSKAVGAKASPELEAGIFNHLYTFFSRYYDDGDFFSKRRYSKKEKYAIPYNGEEVHLHWANSDQYYIKTGEHFTDYKFKSKGVTVHFKLRSADVEQNNVKGEKRFFLPQSGDSTYDKAARIITIPFEYRPLSKSEEVSYGKRNQQEAIIKEAVDKVPKKFKAETGALSALTAEKRKTDKGEPVSYLEHHLRHYTRRNTSDFFIHKDLEGFLTKELDFYLKNEVLNLDELQGGGEERAEGWFHVMRAIKAVGHNIIVFLAQIENFQKRLFEKKKFVLECNYCITLDRIPEEFYEEIAANDTQREEWVRLFAIDEIKKGMGREGYSKSLTAKFVKENPYLLLDTRFFDEDFNLRLLASFDNIDAQCDGVLINSENFQALSLLRNRYSEELMCIYIDPPYNTSENTFVYKNSYKHSSWLSMMQNRIAFSYSFLSHEGVMLVAIDDTETHYLRSILDNVFGEDNLVSTIAAEVNPAGQNLRPNVPARSHDYCHVYARDIDSMSMLLRDLTEEEKAQYKENGDKGFFLWDNLRRRGGNSRPTDRPKQWFPLYADVSSKKVSLKSFDGAEKIWPIDPKGEERIWRVNPDGAKREIENGEISVIKKAGRAEIVKKTWMPEGRKPKTLWKESRHSATTHGTKLLIDILGKQDFSYPKSLYLTQDCIRYWVDEESTVLDFFAGSGTTGHAVINLNREDEGGRKFILAEMGSYFDTVLLPRIKKVVYSKDWKGGKPVSREGCSHMLKYFRLESYEDALNNIKFEDSAGQEAMKFDDYIINYMLAFETRDSETLLNVDKLSAPFSYKLEVTEGQEVKTKEVDLPDTFNYLLGLHVKTQRIYRDEDRKYLVYRGTMDHKEVVIIWRTTQGWKEKDYKRDKKFVSKQKLTEGADEIFVNGDSFIPDAIALDPVFKHRMFGGE